MEICTVSEGTLAATCQKMSAGLFQAGDATRNVQVTAVWPILPSYISTCYLADEMAGEAELVPSRKGLTAARTKGNRSTDHTPLGGVSGLSWPNP